MPIQLDCKFKDLKYTIILNIKHEHSTSKHLKTSEEHIIVHLHSKHANIELTNRAKHIKSTSMILLKMDSLIESEQSDKYIPQTHKSHTSFAHGEQQKKEANR